MRGRRGDEGGSALVETIALLPLLLLAAFVAVQLQLYVSTASDAENAARSASRALRDGDDAYAAARTSLSGTVRDRLRPTDVVVDGERVRVTLRVPLVLDAIDLDVSVLRVSRDAQLPRRG